MEKQQEEVIAIPDIDEDDFGKYSYSIDHYLMLIFLLFFIRYRLFCSRWVQP